MSTHRAPPGDLRARILAEVQATPSPTRDAHQKKAAMLGGGAVAATAVLFFAMGGLKRGARPAELVVFAAGIASVAALLLTRVARPRRGSMLPRPRSTLLAACVSAAPALALAAIAAAALWPEAASEVVPARTDFACAAMTLAQAAVPLAALLVVRRGTDPVHPGISGAALGTAAGGWAAAMAYLRCPHPAASHCVLAHVAPVVVLAIVGAVVGGTLLRVGGRGR